MAAIVLVELAFTLVAAGRTYLAFEALNIDAALSASLVVAASSAMSAAIGLVPAGIGIREGLAAALAGLSGLPPSAGLLASLVLRIAGMVAAAVGAVLTSVIGRHSDPKEDRPPIES